MKVFLIASFVALGTAFVVVSAPAAEKSSIKNAPVLHPCMAPSVASVSGPSGILKDCDDTPEMVAISGGSFDMGDVLGTGYDYERPVHKVQVQGFLIGRYEVTAGEWKACVVAGACPELGGAQDQNPRNPVSMVSWDEARTYVAWLSRHTGQQYRLPSEAEWEYAARSGSDNQYTWGNNEASICKYANILDISGHSAHQQMSWYAGCNDGFSEVAPVGSFPPNAWGLYDMIGNVWEWVEDCWHNNYDGAPDDGRPWQDKVCSKHVNRGGGWGNHARTERVSTRDGDNHGAHSDGLGFRVARNVVRSLPAASATDGTSKAVPALQK